jgi:hypothetical protein
VNLRDKHNWLGLGLLAGLLIAAGCGGSGGSGGGGTPNQILPAVLTMNGSGTDFGDVGVGSTSTLGITFSNTGGSPLTLQQNSLSGAGFASSGIGQGVTLNPGQYVTLALSFQPSVTGKSNGTVSLSSTTSSAPINLLLWGNGVIAAHSATLSWDPSKSVVVGYNIYRTPLVFESWTKISSSPVIATSYTDWDVQGGTTYLYRITSVSPANLESPLSNATVTSIPAP